MLAIVAGSDTTSSVLTAFLYYLLLHPVAYERLQEEIDSAFTGGEEPLDTVKLSHMEWFNACMWVTAHLTVTYFFTFATAMRHFVFSPLSQVVRSVR